MIPALSILKRQDLRGMASIKVTSIEALAICAVRRRLKRPLAKRSGLRTHGPYNKRIDHNHYRQNKGHTTTPPLSHRYIWL